jgi:hypothetical protein
MRFMRRGSGSAAPLKYVPAERSRMVQSNGGETETQKEFKRQLVKAARMYAMCEKAEIPEPLDVVGLAMAAFEDMPLKQALVLVRSNEQNVKDLAWAFETSSSAHEFEQRVKEIRSLPRDHSDRQRG